MAKSRFFKLGKDASTFVDPKSGLVLANSEVVEIPAKGAKNSQLLQEAISSGHIIEVDESEFTKFQKSLKKSSNAKEGIKEEEEEEVEEEEVEEEEVEEEEEEVEEEEEEVEEEEEEKSKTPAKKSNSRRKKR